MELFSDWEVTEKLKWWCGLVAVTTLFVIVTGTGFSVFHLFGANPMWLAVPLATFAGGYALGSNFSPSTFGILMHLAGLVEEVRNLPLSIAPTARQYTDEMGQPIELPGSLEIDSLVSFNPVDYPLVELFDGYTVTLYGHEETSYLEAWGGRNVGVLFTSDKSKACVLPSFRLAGTIGVLYYLTSNGRYKVGIKGVMRDGIAKG